MQGGKSSVEAMEQMIRQLTELESIQEDMQTRVQRTYDDIGSEWNDQQYQNMGAEIDEIVRTLSTCYTSLSESITKL